jgi:hypothetical protein
MASVCAQVFCSGLCDFAHTLAVISDVFMTK